MRLPALRAKLPALLRVAAVACVIALAVLSLLPGKEFVRTDLAKLGHGKQLEHFIAYFGATTILGLAYPARLRPLILALVLIPYAGVLEIAQLYVPGRGASVMDFSASAAGITAGALLLPLAWRTLAVAFTLSPIAVTREREQR